MVPKYQHRSSTKHFISSIYRWNPVLAASWTVKTFLLFQAVFSVEAQGFHNVSDISINASTAVAPSTKASLETLVSDEDAEMAVSSGNWKLNCEKKSCFVPLNSSVSNIEDGLKWTEIIFLRYKNSDSDFLVLEDLELIMKTIGVFHPLENDEAKHSQSHDDHKEVRLPFVVNFVEDANNNSRKCLDNASDVLDEYYPNVAYEEVKISLSDFFLILPRLMYHLSSPACVNTTAHPDEEEHEHGVIEEEVENSRLEVWGTALLSVAGISLLSVIGIMIVPLMGRSIHFHRLLSFLVALAVGTLVGDALLHLLPHATGVHEEDHSHDGNGDEEEKDKIIKSLVAVLGIYFFFVFESGMTMLRKLRQKRRYRASIDVTPQLVVHSPSKSEEFLTTKTDIDDPLLNDPDSPLSSSRGDDVIVKSTDSGISSTNTAYKMSSQPSANSLNPIGNGNTANQPALFPHELNHCSTDESESKASEPKSEEAVQGHDHGHHHHGDIANAQGIKDLAWMIIAGDGLHNFSDGLAIGAAFSSSISAGLSTSLAIFCHELPHELGDFAILIDAGMSVKKAILYNGLCACLAFAGAVIGLLIGEYTTSVKLWILALTAGGFLYVGLVDMLPQMLRQCVEKDGFTRFIYQNIGFLMGVIIMLLIAWYEETFQMIF